MMIHVCLSHVMERALATRVTHSVHTTPNSDITILPWPRADLSQPDKLTDDNTVFAAPAEGTPRDNALCFLISFFEQEILHEAWFK